MTKIPLTAVLWIPMLLLTLGLLSVELIFVEDLRDDLEQLDGMQRSSKTIYKISALVHQLQAERGEGVLFLERQISLSELNDQRQRVDHEIASLSEALDPDQRPPFIQWNDILAQIKESRAQVENRSIAAAKNFADFSDVISRLLNQQMATATVYHYKGLESALSEIVLFEKIKDNLGKLRATISGAVAVKQPISPQTTLQLNELFVGIKTNSELLNLSPASQAKERMERVLSGQDWNRTTEAYNMILNEKKNVLHLDSREVFSSVTSVLEKLRGLINDDFKKSGDTIDHEYKRVWKNFFVICLIFAFTTIVSVTLTVLSTRSLIRSIEILVSLSKKIAVEKYAGANSELHDLVSRDLFFLGTRMDEMGRKLSSTISNLKQANESLEQFAFSTSHDLQEPVKKISSHIEFLEMSIGAGLGDSDRKHVEKIKNSCERAIELIQAMLKLARLSNEKLTIERVDLNEVLMQTIKSLSDEILQINAKIELSSLPEIQGNKELLLNVFQNLLSNSIKYRKKDVSLQVDISWKTGESGEQKILFQDNGIGFDMKKVSVLFKPFGRIHSKDRFPGSGIGLAATKKIMDLHNAKIEVHSEENVGTSFILSFYT